MHKGSNDLLIKSFLQALAQKDSNLNCALACPTIGSCDAKSHGSAPKQVALVDAASSDGSRPHGLSLSRTHLPSLRRMIGDNSARSADVGKGGITPPTRTPET